jgi:hypothetical protein
VTMKKFIDPFTLGVFDDDRTPREKVPPTVRCMDEELLPPVVLPTLGLCRNCGLKERFEKSSECHHCRHARRRKSAVGQGKRAGRHE